MNIKRTDIRVFFDEKARILGSNEFRLSENGLYFFETQRYRQKDPNRNWIVTKIQIGNSEKGNHFFEYVTDNDDTYSLWICKHEKHYLLLPEFLGGQSIFDVSELKLNSHYDERDPFIWTDIRLSPDKTKLAVTGCYWACPYEIVVYDSTNLKALPYTCIYRQLLGYNFQLKEWIDNETILMTNSKNEEQRIKI